MAARHDVAAEFEHVRGAGEFTAEVFEDVQTLAEEEVDGVEDGHAKAVEAAHFDAIEERRRGCGGLDVQLDEAIGRGFVEVAQEHGSGVVRGKLPASPADGAEAEATGFKNAARLGGTGFRDEEIQIKLRAQFEAGNGGRSQRKAFERCEGKAEVLETVLDGGPFGDEGHGACSVVGEIAMQAHDDMVGQEAGEIFPLDAIEEIKGQAAEIEPIESLLPFAPREQPQAQAFFGDWIAESQEQSFADALFVRERNLLRPVVKGARKVRCCGTVVLGDQARPGQRNR